MFEVRQPFFNVDASDSGWDFSAIPLSETANDEETDEVSEVETLKAEGNEEAETAEEKSDEAASEEETATDAEEKPAFNDETEVDLGNGTQPVKFAELKQGYLRQSDYTKKTQLLADERKTFETERAEWEPVKGLNDFLGSNPWLAGEINRFVQEFTTTGAISIEDALADAQYGQYINSLLAQTNQLTKELESYKGKVGELEFSGTMRDLKGELKTEYGDLATDDYLSTIEKRAKDEKLPLNVLKEIAEAQLSKKKLEQVQAEGKKASKKAEADTIKSLQEQRKTTPPGPGSKGQRPADEAPDTNQDWGGFLKSIIKK